MCVQEITFAQKRQVHFLKLQEDCCFEKFTIKSIVNNGSTVVIYLNKYQMLPYLKGEKSEVQAQLVSM